MTEQKREYFKRRREKAYENYNALMKFYPLNLDDLPGEIWHDIEGNYQISNFGRIKSLKHKKPRIMRPSLSRTYLFVNLRIDGHYKIYPVHRLVAQAFISNPENKPQVNHLDGNKFNNHVSNLEWATSAENNRHANSTGLMPLGENRYNSKLTNEQVQLIRENPDNLSLNEFAEMFGVYASRIGAIQLGKIYRNVGGSIRKPKKSRVPDAIRKKIRAEFIEGELGARALGRKYDVDHKTILRIVNEGQ